MEKWSIYKYNPVNLDKQHHYIGVIKEDGNIFDDNKELVCKTNSILDAKLIAAAPEMFEALKSVLKYLEDNSDILAPFPTRSEIDRIRAALIKAGAELDG